MSTMFRTGTMQGAGTMQGPRSPGFGSRLCCVVKAWAKSPLQVATVCPSSPFLTRRISDRECIRNARRVIELGPGAGGTTQALLRRMRPDARLLAIEKTTAFESILRQIQDPRLDLEMGDATDLVQMAEQHHATNADVVVSGIPFSTVPDLTAKRIAQSVHAVLREGGVFIAYQLRADVTQHARDMFGPPQAEVVKLNVPPLNVFKWDKVSGNRPSILQR